MTPSQLTAIVSFLGSLGHSLDGLANLGIRIAAPADLVDQIRAFDHPDAAAVADRMISLRNPDAD